MATTTAPPELSDRPARAATHTALGIGLLVGGALLSAIAFALSASAFGSTGPFQATIWPTVAMLILDWTLLAVGAVLRARRPDHAMGWIFLVLGSVAAVTMAIWALMVVQQLPGGNRELGRLVAWAGAVSTLPAWTYLLTVLIVRFPSGVPETDAERRLLRWAAPAAIFVMIAAAFRPGPLLVYPLFENPISLPEGVRWAASLAAVIGVAISIVPVVLAVSGMVRKYRAAESIERHQLRWFAFAAAISLTTGLLYIVVGVFLAPDRSDLREGTFALFVGSACSLPIAVLVAISRYHLYDIDRIIGRAVAYGALTAVLAGIYAASVRLFNALFVVVTGEGSEIALVLTTLVLATTFTPIKGYLERLAAKRFPAEPREPATDGPARLAPEDLLFVAPADLDARIEAIARRVAADVLREERQNAGGR